MTILSPHFEIFPSFFGAEFVEHIGRVGLKFNGAGCMRGLNNSFPPPGADDVHRQVSLRAP